MHELVLRVLGDALLLSSQHERTRVVQAIVVELGDGLLGRVRIASGLWAEGNRHIVFIISIVVLDLE